MNNENQDSNPSASGEPDYCDYQYLAILTGVDGGAEKSNEAPHDGDVPKFKAKLVRVPKRRTGLEEDPPELQ